MLKEAGTGHISASASDASDTEESVILEKPEHEEQPGSGQAVAEPTEGEAHPDAADETTDDFVAKEDTEGDAEEEKGDDESAAAQKILEQSEPADVPLPEKKEKDQSEEASAVSASEK